MRTELASATHAGMVRAENQDRQSRFLSPFGEVFIVADGMGGVLGGATAAAMVVDGFAAHLNAIPPGVDLGDALQQAASQVNEDIVRAAASGAPGRARMGATVVLAVVQGGHVVIAHAGDSRAYLFRDRRLSRLTHDHSLVQRMLDHQMLTEEEARVHPDSNVVTRALGLAGGCKLEISGPLPIEPWDGILLCTDGLYRELDDTEIERTLLRHLAVPMSVCDVLLEACLASGAQDNVTMQYLRFAPEENGGWFARLRRWTWVVLLLLLLRLVAAEIAPHPFQGITYIDRVETLPRNLRMHVVLVDLEAPGIRFKLTPPGGSLETTRQSVLEFLRQRRAQVAVNAHYFLPFPSSSPDAKLIGFAASEGTIYSAFETPEQSYALVRDAPALNIDARNHAAIVHRDPAFADGRHILEKVTVWNAVAGSAQIVTGGVKTIPRYGPGGLTPGGPNRYSAEKSWYEQINARTAIGLTRDARTLVLFTVDARGGSLGMRVSEVAGAMIADYHVWDALNLDGGGSTTLAIEDPASGEARLVNVSSDNPAGRKVGSSLAVFAAGAKVNWP